MGYEAGLNHHYFLNSILIKKTDDKSYLTNNKLTCAEKGMLTILNTCFPADKFICVFDLHEYIKENNALLCAIIKSLCNKDFIHNQKFMFKYRKDEYKNWICIKKKNIAILNIDKKIKEETRNKYIKVYAEDLIEQNATDNIFFQYCIDTKK